MTTAALVFPTLGLDVGAARAGVVTPAWTLGPACDSYIGKAMARVHKGAPYHADLVGFPYRLTAAELAADIWLTGNVLPCAQALRRLAALGAAAHPSYVIAHLPGLEQVPASVRALRDTGLFAQIEWVAEKCFDHHCNIDAEQYFLCGTMKKAVAVAEAEGGAPKLSLDPQPLRPADVMTASSWVGPLALDPKADDGHPISIINLFRHGAVTWTVESLVRALIGGDGLAEYRDEADAFARFTVDEHHPDRGEVIVKLVDGSYAQRLLDGSLENFYAAFPKNGVCRANGVLVERRREYDVVFRALPTFTACRNVRYMAAMLGLPDSWLPMQ